MLRRMMLLRVRLFCPHPPTQKGLHTVDELYIAETGQSPHNPHPLPVLYSDRCMTSACCMHGLHGDGWMQVRLHTTTLIIENSSVTECLSCLYNANDYSHYIGGEKNQQLLTAFFLERIFCTLKKDAGPNFGLTASQS